MPILWWIWIHNIQERCLLGKDFSLLKAPSLTPSESINISKGRIILINHWQHTISIDVEIEDLFPLSSSPHRLWWRGSGMVDTRRGSGRCHLFLHWVFYWRVFPRCSALRWPGPGPGHTARHAAGHAPPPATPTPPPAPDQLHQLDSCTCVYFTLNLHR